MKNKTSNYQLALENALYDFYRSLGDLEEDIGNGGSYRGHHYEPTEVPLAVVAHHIGFKIQAGMGYRHLEQLVSVGLYALRKTGPGKPSFLKLLVWDHDEHFAIKANARIQFVEQRAANEREASAVLPALKLDLTMKLHQLENPTDQYAFLRDLLTRTDRLCELSKYWAAWKAHQQRMSTTNI